MFFAGCRFESVVGLLAPEISFCSPWGVFLMPRECKCSVYSYVYNNGQSVDRLDSCLHLLLLLRRSRPCLLELYGQARASGDEVDFLTRPRSCAAVCAAG
jgi:hypothetical protein